MHNDNRNRGQFEATLVQILCTTTHIISFSMFLVLCNICRLTLEFNLVNYFSNLNFQINLSDMHFNVSLFILFLSTQGKFSLLRSNRSEITYSSKVMLIYSQNILSHVFWQIISIILTLIWISKKVNSPWSESQAQVWQQ